jgi:hypothetical protein
MAKKNIQEEPIKQASYCKKCTNGIDVKNYLVLCKVLK